MFSFLISPFFIFKSVKTSYLGGFAVLNIVAFPVILPEKSPEKFSTNGGKNDLKDSKFKLAISNENFDSFDCFFIVTIWFSRPVPLENLKFIFSRAILFAPVVIRPFPWKSWPATFIEFQSRLTTEGKRVGYWDGLFARLFFDSVEVLDADSASFFFPHSFCWINFSVNLISFADILISKGLIVLRSNLSFKL